MYKKYKPKFIHSSDILEQVRHLADEHIGQQSWSEEVTVNVNIELNALFIRNKHLKPTELIRDNMISLARIDSKKKKLKLDELIFTINHDEIYIVTLVLVLELTVNKLVGIDFYKDENYRLLLLCDKEMIIQIERYIRVIVEIMAIQHTSIQHTNETQEIIDDEIQETHDGGSKDTYLNLSSSLPQISIDSLLLTGKTSDPIDYNSSMEDLLLLKSNDTTRSCSDVDILDDLQDLLGEEFIRDINNLRHNNDYIRIEDIEEIQDDLLDIHEMDDVQENDIQENDIQENDIQEDDIQEMGAIQDLGRNPEEKISRKSLRLKNLHSTIDATNTIEKVLRKTIRPEKLNIDILAPPLIQRVNLLTPPPSASRTPTRSSSFIVEQKLEFDSSLVPTYIKQDKKFKFIKVGKVQKFVQKFEEQLTSVGGEV